MGWFGNLDTRGRRAFWACFGGWTLDAMDVQIYALVMPTLIAVWGLTKAEAGLLATAALLSSALGGVIASFLADRLGRVKVLQLSILWFSAFTFLSGLSASYEQLMIFRVLQGIGFGGEWAAGAVLIAEIVQPKDRGKAVAAVSSGWAVGYGLAAVIFTLFFNIFEPAMAWRMLFFTGLLPTLLIIYIRRAVTDSDIYLAERAKADAGADARAGAGAIGDPRAIFRPDMRRRTFAGAMICLGVLGGNYTVLTWLPAYLQSARGLSYSSTGLFLLVNIAGSFAGYILGGYVSDRLGRKRALRIFAVLGVVAVVSYLYFATSTLIVLVLGFPLGFAQSGMNAGLGPFLSELFPTRFRATGQGFCYNGGRGVGAIFPALVGWLAVDLGLEIAIMAAAATAYATAFIFSFALPETRGIDLE